MQQFIVAKEPTMERTILSSEKKFFIDPITFITEQELTAFSKMGRDAIRSLETPSGILASSTSEAYGSIFGRDSLLTALRLLRVYNLNYDRYYMDLAKKILTGLIPLLGKEVNIESGEEPGKCIHNYISDPLLYKKLTEAKNETPWYLYPDEIFRNYDSIDSTPLFLICAYRYLQKSKDIEFIESNLKAIESSLNWVMLYGDKNNDGFIDFQKHLDRKFGGLVVQNWMDSHNSLFHEDGTPVAFPVATCEVQGYTYLALKLWSGFFTTRNIDRSRQLLKCALDLRKRFNQSFVLGYPKNPTFAFAIDNNGKPLVAKRSNIGHLLWAAINPQDDNRHDCIIEENLIESAVKTLMEPDIFEPKAGVRTLSSQSNGFDQRKYHGGPIWPHDSSIVAEGMENFGYVNEAQKIRLALFIAFNHFQTPIEVFTYNDGIYDTWKVNGITAGATESCKVQAWSAASMLLDSLLLLQQLK